MGKRTTAAGAAAAPRPQQKKHKESLNSDVIKLRGAKDLRSRLVLATLARKKLEIGGIRADDESPGLRKEEASFVRLMDKLTSGSRIEINETGTTLRYAPGFLAGGSVEHDCSRSGRAVGWFLDAVLPLAPFGAAALELTLLGATCGDGACRGADAIRARSAAEGVRRRGLRRRVARREAAVLEEDKTEALLAACASAARGNIVLTCAPIRKLSPAALDAVGLVKRVRGVAYCTRSAPALANRCVAAARGPLNRLLADVRVTTDAAAKRDCFPSPGLGCCLVAETLDDRVLCADLDAHWYRTEAGDRPTPEDLGEAAAFVLLGEVNRGGVCDDHGQPLLFTLMALGPEDVSSAVTGPLTDRAVGRLRLIRQFLGVRFKLTRNGDGTVRSACLGAGYQNFAKPVT
ncbi:RNA-3'-phosphate cyclase [Aureococcus anophagefferens]|nr:RNA-3'-phosphate cyclase [Aureococcus anophagefferens]